MDISHPLRSVIPSLDSHVLEVLAGTTRPITGREIARLSGGSVSGVRLVLQRLVHHGLVEREERANSSFYTANRDHLAWPAISELLKLGMTLESKMRELIASWEVQPLSLSIYGSVARGEADADSDIDLLVIEPPRVADHREWDTQVHELASAVESWTGNRVQLTMLTHEGLLERVRASDAIVSSWRTDARTLAGLELRKLL